MKRIFLFLLTNLAVVFVLSIALRLESSVSSMSKVLDSISMPCWRSLAFSDLAAR